jgi:hypothetical protein
MSKIGGFGNWPNCTDYPVRTSSIGRFATFYKLGQKTQNFDIFHNTEIAEFGAKALTNLKSRHKITDQVFNHRNIRRLASLCSV